jgi:hypothetical protein
VREHDYIITLIDGAIGGKIELFGPRKANVVLFFAIANHGRDATRRLVHRICRKVHW